jgi:serine O-acetyltransferase
MLRFFLMKGMCDLLLWVLYNSGMSFYEFLVYARKNPFFGKLAYFGLKLLGAEIPVSVAIGPGFLLHHGGVGVVIHPKTVIGARVGIYPGVTLGRADVYRPASQSQFVGIIVEDDVILGAGAKILCEKGTLCVGRGTIVGANAVLLESTGENEMWAGIPAKKVGQRV